MSDITYIILYVLLFTGANYFVQIIYFTLGWIRINYFDCLSNNLSTKVSILIPFRNEENNIITCLESIIKQDFPSQLFEIILIDDHSTDLSLKKVKEFKAFHSEYNIAIIELKDIFLQDGSKKMALSTGVNYSSGELIVTTDADCIMTAFWLKNLVAYYEKYNPSAIVAPVSFFNGKSIFDDLQHLEFLSLQSIGAASIGINHPILSNGANFAYKREIFYAVNGFENNKNIASGDDVFLLHQIHKMFPGTVHYIKSFDAMVYTTPQKSLSAFINQRRRWASKSRSYKDNFALYVAMSVFLFNVSLLMALLLSVFNPIILLYFCVFYAAKILVEFPLLFKITKFVKRKKLLWYIPLLELFYPIYIVFTAVYAYFGSYQWKGRRIKQ